MTERLAVQTPIDQEAKPRGWRGQGAARARASHKATSWPVTRGRAVPVDKDAGYLRTVLSIHIGAGLFPKACLFSHAAGEACLRVRRLATVHRARSVASGDRSVEMIVVPTDGVAILAATDWC